MDLFQYARKAMQIIIFKDIMDSNQLFCVIFTKKYLVINKYNKKNQTF